MSVNLTPQGKPKQHELKTWPAYFQDMRTGRKRFEVREDDRAFLVNDQLVLREWDEAAGRYTGRKTVARITYKLEGDQFGIECGFCVLGIECLRDEDDGGEA